LGNCLAGSAADVETGRLESEPEGHHLGLIRRGTRVERDCGEKRGDESEGVASTGHRGKSMNVLVAPPTLIAEVV